MALDGYLIFFPSENITRTPSDAGLPYEDVWFTASDGTSLHGWFIPGDGVSNKTLIWFHGNAGNISDRLDNLTLMRHRIGANIFIFDYRGYGHSKGKPSEQGLYLDGEAALDYLISERDVEPHNLVLFGRSLGCAVAVEMAMRRPHAGLILESPFTSVSAMAQRLYPLIAPILPVRWLVKSRFDTLSKMERVQSPVLVMHGNNDQMVPISMGKQIFEAANEPRHFYAIEGAGHNNTYIVGGEAYFATLDDFVHSTSD